MNNNTNLWVFESEQNSFSLYTWIVENVAIVGIVGNHRGCLVRWILTHCWCECVDVFWCEEMLSWFLLGLYEFIGLFFFGKVYK